MPKAEARRFSLRVQTVAHAYTTATLLRYAEALAQSLDNARSADLIGEAVVALGDCSEKAALGKKVLDSLGDAVKAGGAGFAYERFGANVGYAEGQNRLFRQNDSELLLLCNDDVVVGPQAVTELVKGLIARPEVGPRRGPSAPLREPEGIRPCDRGDLLVLVGLRADAGEAFLRAWWPRCRVVLPPWSRRRLLLAPEAFRSRMRVQALCAGHRSTSAWTTRVRCSPRPKRHATQRRRTCCSARSTPSRGRLSERLAWYGEHGTKAQRQVAVDFRDRQTAGRLPSPVPGAERVALFLDGSYAARRFA